MEEKENLEFQQKAGIGSDKGSGGCRVILAPWPQQVLQNCEVAFEGRWTLNKGLLVGQTSMHAWDLGLRLGSPVFPSCMDPRLSSLSEKQPKDFKVILCVNFKQELFASGEGVKTVLQWMLWEKDSSFRSLFWFIRLTLIILRNPICFSSLVECWWSLTRCEMPLLQNRQHAQCNEEELHSFSSVSLGYINLNTNSKVKRRNVWSIAFSSMWTSTLRFPFNVNPATVKNKNNYGWILLGKTLLCKVRENFVVRTLLLFQTNTSFCRCFIEPFGLFYAIKRPPVKAANCCWSSWARIRSNQAHMKESNADWRRCCVRSNNHCGTLGFFYDSQLSQYVCRRYHSQR